MYPPLQGGELAEVSRGSDSSALLAMALRHGLSGMRPLGQLRVIQEKAAPSLGSQAGPWPVITNAVQLCDPKAQVVVRDEVVTRLRQLNDRPGVRALAQLNLQGLAPADKGEKAVELATGHSLRRSAERRGLTLCTKRAFGTFAQKREEERWFGSLTVHGRLPPVAVLVLGGEAAQARPCSTFRTGEGAMQSSPSGGGRSGARSPRLAQQPTGSVAVITRSTQP